MLAYVAVTRAKQTLDRGGLAWIDDQLTGVAALRPARRRATTGTTSTTTRTTCCIRDATPATATTAFSHLSWRDGKFGTTRHRSTLRWSVLRPIMR